MALFDSTFAPYQAFGSRPLTLGVQGSDIAVLQTLYNVMVKTFNAPDSPWSLGPIPVTGRYDAETQAAILNVQRYWDLTVDGQVGDETYWAFGQGVGLYETFGGPAYGSRPLVEGMSGGDVTVLQNRLGCFSYAGALSHPASGLFDAATAEAVAAFKATAHLHGNTGLFPNATVGFGSFSASWIYTFAGGRTLYSGRKGLDVVFVQKFLQGLGHYQGYLTGYYDPATEHAVESFQALHGLTIDGVVGPTTFYHLGRANAGVAPDPMPVGWPPAVVRVGSIALSPISSEIPSSFGVAALASSSHQGGQWLNVVGDNLPSPDAFGSGYTTYAFTLADAASGSVTVPQVMLVVPQGRGTWAGSLSQESGAFTPGVIHVYPSNPSDSRLASPILEGNLVNQQEG